MKVEEILEHLKIGTLDDPTQLSNFLVVLSAKLYEAANLETEMRMAYAQAWLDLKTDAMSAKECDMRAMLTEHYKQWQKIASANKAMKECINALKKKLSVTIY